MNQLRLGLAVLGLLSGTALAGPADSPTSKPFRQEIRTEYTRADGLPSIDVRRVAVDAEGRVWAATAGGTARFDGRSWSTTLGSARAIVSEAAVDASGFLWAVPVPPERGVALRLQGTVIKQTEFSSISIGLTGSGILLDVAFAGNHLYVAGERGLWHTNPHPEALSPVREAFQGDQLLGVVNCTRVAVSPSGHVAVVVDDHDVSIREAQGEWQPLGHVAVKIRQLAFDSDDNLWIVTGRGPARFDREQKQWEHFTTRDGLPVDEATCIAFGPEGSLWLGTPRGVMRRDGRTWAYRAGRRWLPSDDVRDIAVAADGTAWIATAAGISRIERQPVTLADKAAHYETLIDARHRRFGYITVADLARPGDLSEWSLADTDNDGLWTGMYGAGECFRYAATKDPQARLRATGVFQALNRLHAVTGIPGFPARTVLPTSGPDPNDTYTVKNDRRSQQNDPLWKVITPRWPKSADGKWFWKCDTSSDEIDGHFFFYAAFYDHVARTSTEKARAAGVIRAMTDHIIENDFFLVDHDGRPTRWGVWNPDKLNHDIAWIQERGLNSLEMLSFLATAHHVTGDDKYVKITRDLVDNHHFAINLQNQKVTFPPEDINHSDDEMAFMCYYLLIRYTKDIKLLALYKRSLRRSWQFERPERNPLFNFIYAACGGEPYDRDEAVDTLRRIPWDLIDWRMSNRGRADVHMIDDGIRPAGAWRAYPPYGVMHIDERYVQWWNHNPYIPDTGGQGRREADGAFFLLPYYLGLCHGLLE